MKRRIIFLSVVATVLFAWAAGMSTLAAPPRQATPAPTDISIGPANSTPTPTAKPLQPGDTDFGGTAAPTAPAFVLPPKLDDLLKQYPDLQPFLDKIKGLAGVDLPFDDLYAKIIEIYKDKGATGVAVFLKDSGILDKLNIPLSYLDLLYEFDKSGPDGVKKLAQDRKIINDKDEIVGYLAIDDASNADSVKAALAKTGVSIYGFQIDTDELEIGIPLDLLGQFQTPGPLIKFLVSIATADHVVGFRAPKPVIKAEKDQKGKTTVGAKTIGADKWIAAGITGKGVKIGIFDMGFGGIKAALGKELPATVTTNVDVDTLDSQEENHGLACAEIAHAAAPDAQLFLAYFDGESESSFVDALDFLKQNGVQIISYSIGSVVGPRDGTFGDALIADEFIKDTGVLWVAAAGNDGIDHTRFQYVDDGQGNNVFGTDKKGKKVTGLPFKAGISQTSIILDWSGNWDGKEKNEFDLNIYDQDGNQIAQGDEAKKGRKNDYPFQATVVDTNPGDVYYLTVNYHGNAAPDNTIMDIFINNGLLPTWAQVPQYAVSSPGDSDSVLTVGATGLTQDQIEDYSSEGPTTDDRLKPDISAPTGEKLSVSGFEDGFFGTSGSTPLTAGAAALVLQAFPDFTAPQVKAYLEKASKDLGDKGADPVYGSGRLALGPVPKNAGGGGGDNGNGGDTGNPTATPKGGDNGDGGDTGNPTATPKGGGGDNGNTGDVTATISDSSVKFNVTQKGKKGVLVTLSFEVDNFSGKQGAVAILFLQKDGKTPLTPKDKNFTVGKTIGVFVPFIPKSDQAAYDGAQLFIPNSAFAGISASTKQISYVVVVLDFSDENNPQILTATDPTLVNIK